MYIYLFVILFTINILKSSQLEFLDLIIVLGCQITSILSKSLTCSFHNVRDYCGAVPIKIKISLYISSPHSGTYSCFRLATAQLPYIDYMGICRCTGHGFEAFLLRTGFRKNGSLGLVSVLKPWGKDESV